MLAWKKNSIVGLLFLVVFDCLALSSAYRIDGSLDEKWKSENVNDETVSKFYDSIKPLNNMDERLHYKKKRLMPQRPKPPPKY